MSSVCIANQPSTVFSDDTVMGLASANPEPRRNEKLSGTLSSSSILGTSLRISGNAVIGGTFQAANFAGGALTTSTISGSIGSFGTLTTNDATISQNLNIGGIITNNVTGSLQLRVYDDTGLYTATAGTLGQPLPPAGLSRPVGSSQISSIDYTSAVFEGLQSSYSCRISGYLLTPQTGTYSFRVTARDGISAWISQTKVADSWVYQSNEVVTVTDLLMYQNMWSPIYIQHATATTSERLLIEWAYNGGSYTTLSHASDDSNFGFAYVLEETFPAQLGTTYVSGKMFANDQVTMPRGASFESAPFFSGLISQLENDAGYYSEGFTNTGTVSGTILRIIGSGSVGGLMTTGTISSSLLNVANGTVSKTLMTGTVTGQVCGFASITGTNLAVSGDGSFNGTLSAQTLDVLGNLNFNGTLLQNGSAYISSQWVTSGTNLSYSQGAVDISDDLIVSGLIENNVTGALQVRVYDDTGLYDVIAGTIGESLPPPGLTKLTAMSQTSSLDWNSPTFGSLTAKYSTRVTGYILTPQTGTYTFKTTTRDGARLWINQSKLADSWQYEASATVTIGSLTMYQNIWSPLFVEHGCATSSEKLLVEYALNGGSYSVLEHSTTGFQFAYEAFEIPPTQLNTTYVSGQMFVNDTANFYGGMTLAESAFFTGFTSQLANDAGFIQTGATITGTALNITGPFASVSGILSAAGGLVAPTAELDEFGCINAAVSGTLTARSATITTLAGSVLSLTGNIAVGGAANLTKLSGWSTLQFASGTVNYDNSQPAQFCIDELGYVRLRGKITGYVLNGTCFTIPASGKPRFVCHFAIATSDSNVQSCGVLQLNQDGSASVNSGGGVWADLNGVVFDLST